MTLPSQSTITVRQLLCLYIEHSLLLYLSYQSILLTTETYCIKESIIENIGNKWRRTGDSGKETCSQGTARILF